MITDITMFILELIGTVSFAVSGALVAVKARLDLFGVVFTGCITAVGGGILRDMLIGATPPAIFGRLHFVAVAALPSKPCSISFSSSFSSNRAIRTMD